MYGAYFPSTCFPPTYFPGYVPGVVVLVPGTFNEAGITDIRADRFDADMYLTFSTDWPNGSYYQIYINHTLKWVGTTTRVVIPGVGGGPLIVHVGNVAPENRNADFSATLPEVVPAGARARVTWAGGRWISPNLSGFHIYISVNPGSPIDWTNRVGDVPARHGSDWGDGFGRGPFGRGPFGRGVVAYRWVSGPLRTGIYQVGIRAYDSSGTESADTGTQSVSVVAPPSVVPTFGDGTRLRSTLSPTTLQATLTWNPST